MALLLDTDLLPHSARAGAVHDAMAQASVPSAVSCEVTDDGPRARMDLWQLGRGADLFSCRGTGIRLTRAPRHVAQAAPDRLALAVQTSGTGRYEQAGRQLVVPQGELMLVDLSSTYDFSWSGPGGSVAFQVDLAHVGLPVEVVRRAAGRLAAGAGLYALLRGHLSLLHAEAEALTASSEAARVVGSATSELVRALLVEAADDDARRGEVLAGALPARIVAWVDQHLTDPDLTPARIAAEHAVSVRQLYKIWPEPQVGVSAWIVRERLEGARRALADPGCRLGIAAVARRWGFVDATHFSRRFRAAYGLSPRDWREARRSLPAVVVPGQRAAP